MLVFERNCEIFFRETFQHYGKAKKGNGWRVSYHFSCTHYSSRCKDCKLSKRRQDAWLVRIHRQDLKPVTWPSVCAQVTLSLGDQPNYQSGGKCGWLLRRWRGQRSTDCSHPQWYNSLKGRTQTVESNEGCGRQGSRMLAGGGAAFAQPCHAITMAHNDLATLFCNYPWCKGFLAHIHWMVHLHIHTRQ